MGKKKSTNIPSYADSDLCEEAKMAKEIMRMECAEISNNTQKILQTNGRNLLISKIYVCVVPLDSWSSKSQSGVVNTEPANPNSEPPRSESRISKRQSSWDIFGRVLTHHYIVIECCQRGSESTPTSRFQVEIERLEDPRKGPKKQKLPDFSAVAAKPITGNDDSETFEKSLKKETLAYAPIEMQGYNKTLSDVWTIARDYTGALYDLLIMETDRIPYEVEKTEDGEKYVKPEERINWAPGITGENRIPCNCQSFVENMIDELTNREMVGITRKLLGEQVSNRLLRYGMVAIKTFGPKLLEKFFPQILTTFDELLGAALKFKLPPMFATPLFSAILNAGICLALIKRDRQRVGPTFTQEEFLKARNAHIAGATFSTAFSIIFVICAAMPQSLFVTIVVGFASFGAWILGSWLYKMASRCDWKWPLWIYEAILKVIHKVFATIKFALADVRKLSLGRYARQSITLAAP